MPSLVIGQDVAPSCIPSHLQSTLTGRGVEPPALTQVRCRPSIRTVISRERLLHRDPAATRPVALLVAGLIVLVGAAGIVFVQPVLTIAFLAALIVAPFILGNIDLAFLAVVAVITLLPFGAIPLGLGFNPTFLDLVLGILYLIWIVRIALREQQRRQWLPLSPAVLLFIGLLFVALVAGIAQGVPTKNQLRTFAELVLSAGLFFIVGDLITDRRSLRRVFLALVGFGCLAAVIGLVLYLMPDTTATRLLSSLSVVGYPTGSTVLRYINDDPSRLQRATGTSVDPNSFGGMLAVITALLLPQLISHTPLVPRRAALVMTAIMVAALVVTVSRGSLAGLAAAVIVIGLVRDRRLLAMGLAVVAVIVGLARVIPWTASYVSHFAAGLAGADRATQMRFGEYKDAFALIRRYPVFGVGFGDVRDVDLYRGVSSLYLIIAETMGMVGLAAFLGLAAACYARIALAWRAMSADVLRAVVLGCLAALTAALVSGVVDHYFFTYPHAFALLWLVIGVAMSAIRLADEEAATTSAAR
jgi:polysaccharide biosynthesis protein PslJ